MSGLMVAQKAPSRLPARFTVIRIQIALALFQRYKKEGPSFARQYLRILAGGGSKNPKKLLLEHGVDIDSRKFWQGGFDYVGEQISKLQTLL